MEQVQEHYGKKDLTEKVELALKKYGFQDSEISLESLEPLDQFHIGGRTSTLSLVSELKLGHNSKVLDIGSGLGGPARFTANEYGCQVTGVDLNPQFIAVAELLSKKASYRGQVDFVTADALQLPFSDAAFDHAFTQHVAMNIENRPQLYQSIARVLKPSGKLALFDVIVGNGEPVHYPTPWSRTGETSFLFSAEQTKEILKAEGFREISWIDQSADGLEWFKKQSALLTAGQVFGLPVIMGPEFATMASNFARNLKEGRIKVVQAVFQKLTS